MKSAQFLHNEELERINNLMNVGQLLEDGFVEQEEIEVDDDDKEMIEGIAELLRMVEDKDNRMKMAEKVIRDFERDDVKYSKEDFMRMINL
jgi:hypothetical protein